MTESATRRPGLGVRLLRRVGLAVAAAAVAVAAGEILVRVANPLGVSQFDDMLRYNTQLCLLAGPPRILKHKPAARIDFFDFSIRTNALGLRGDEIPEPKPAGERRLLFLGDSVVLGWGAREEDLFVTRLERALNENASAGERYRCVNAGHNLHDTVQEAGVLEELGDRIQPDAVVLVYVGNDVVLTSKLWEQFSSLPAPDRWTRWIGWLRGVPLRGWSGLLTYWQTIASGAEEARFAEAVGAALDAEGWRSSHEAILRIRDWCAARGVPFLVLDHTNPAAAGRPADIPGLAPALEAAGIPRFEFHFTPEENARPIRHSASDPHANAAGHALLLEKLRPAIRSIGWPVR